MTVRRVLVLNGPNLGRLGVREPEIYGDTTHAELVAMCQKWGEELSLDVEVRQTDSEAELILWLQEATDARIPVAVNAGAFTHYSYALRYALAQVPRPTIEVHLSNPASRESFRHTSVIASVVTGSISGFGVQSYALALAAIASCLDE